MISAVEPLTDEEIAGIVEREFYDEQRTCAYGLDPREIAEMEEAAQVIRERLAEIRNVQRRAAATRILRGALEEFS